MKKIIIIGAGGYGRELLQWIKDINEATPTWNIAGFIDDNLNALDSVECNCTVIGKVSEWVPNEDEEFALALGDPTTKKEVTEMMKARGAQFATVIHPTATITPFSHYGEGFVMFPYAKLSVNSSVGKFVTLLSSGVGHDVYIDDYTTISGACNILRDVKIGKRVFIAAGASVAQGIEVGDDAYVGLGSVVIKNVSTGVHVFGNPARSMLC